MDRHPIKKMKAAIDIGTNTVLLLVASIENQQLKVIHEEQRIPRLGKGVDAEGSLSEDSMERVIAVLKEYKEFLSANFSGVDEVIVTATSAVRDASNREEFINKVFLLTGYSIRLLSGDEEASFTYRGAISVIDENEKADVFVLDIGGGSTEVALGRKNHLIDAHSFDMGCVRFTERYLIQDPPFQEQIKECREAITTLFEGRKFKSKRKVISVGVAGTITSLAAVNLQLEEYEPDKMNGHVVERDKLQKGIEIFSLHTHDQLLELSPKILQGREDIFLAGLLILEEFLNYFGLDAIIVSTGGIRHGVLLDAFAQ